MNMMTGAENFINTLNSRVSGKDLFIFLTGELMTDIGLSLNHEWDQK